MKKTLSLISATTMAIGLIGATAFAANTQPKHENNVIIVDTTQNINSGTAPYKLDSIRIKLPNQLTLAKKVTCPVMSGMNTTNSVCYSINLSNPNLKMLQFVIRGSFPTAISSFTLNVNPNKLNPVLNQSQVSKVLILSKGKVGKDGPMYYDLLNHDTSKSNVPGGASDLLKWQFDNKEYSGTFYLSKA